MKLAREAREVECSQARNINYRAFRKHTADVSKHARNAASSIWAYRGIFISIKRIAIRRRARPLGSHLRCMSIYAPVAAWKLSRASGINDSGGIIEARSIVMESSNNY